MTAIDRGRLARPSEVLARLALATVLAGVAVAAIATERPSVGDASTAGAQTSAPGAPSAPNTVSEGGPAMPWLDEVRAQRHAWEERRRATREAFEARRRAQDPWGAAQQEAWHEDVERRREARRHYREQAWERFRDLGPPLPAAPWDDPAGPPPPPPEPGGPGVRAPGVPGGEATYPPGAPPSAPFAPQDWDNPWYFRGY